MSDLDIKHFAQKMLNMTKNMSGNYNYPIPVKRLRALCNNVLNNEVEAVSLPVLTDVENSVLQAIKQDHMQGIQPTVRTVADRLDYKTPSSAAVVINRLIKHGYIKREGSRKQIVVVNGRS
jgi:DNA-binding MarR family transcriptional regulator